MRQLSSYGWSMIRRQSLPSRTLAERMSGSLSGLETANYWHSLRRFLSDAGKKPGTPMALNEFELPLLRDTLMDFSSSAGISHQAPYSIQGHSPAARPEIQTGVLPCARPPA